MKAILSLLALLFCAGCGQSDSPIKGVWEQSSGVKYTTTTEFDHEPLYESEQTHFSIWYFDEDYTGYYRIAERKKVPFSYEVDGNNLSVSPFGVGSIWRGSIEGEGQQIHLNRNETLVIDSWTWSNTYDLELRRNQKEKRTKVD